MSHVYSLHGLRLEADLPIAGLAPATDAADPDLRVCLGRMPDWWPLAEPGELRYRSPHRTREGRPLLEIRGFEDGRFLRFLYQDDCEFLVEVEAGRVWCTWPEEFTQADAAVYLLGPILGYLLRQWGVVCLHASAVVVDGRAVAFMGPAGAGKSTTAASFALDGHAALSDDLVSLEERRGEYLARPASPRLTLWPEAVQALLGPDGDLPAMTPNWTKRYLDLVGSAPRFQEEPLPLAAIYLLGKRRRESDEPCLEQIPSSTALMSLVANTYGNYFLDREQRAEEFAMLARLNAAIAVKRLRPAPGRAGLARLRELVLDDLAQLARQRVRAGS